MCQTVRQVVAVVACLVIAFGAHGAGRVKKARPDTGRAAAGAPASTTGTVPLQDMLRGDVVMLAGSIGERNTLHYDRLCSAATYIESELKGAGCKVRRQCYGVEDLVCCNVEGVIRGTSAPDEIVVVGAHYDSARGTPGANDNASGVAAMLAIARTLHAERPARTLRFVAFVNEEPPYFQTSSMGSRVYAEECRRNGDNIVAMFCLETIGYYSDKAHTQHYPPPLNVLYPSTGNFLAFVANSANAGLVTATVRSFRRHATFPVESAAVSEILPGVTFSDHASFWKSGYPALMITDTALYRYAHYHEPEDTPDKVQYTGLAEVVKGMIGVVRELVTKGRT